MSRPAVDEQADVLQHAPVPQQRKTDQFGDDLLKAHRLELLRTFGVKNKFIAVLHPKEDSNSSCATPEHVGSGIGGLQLIPNQLHEKSTSVRFFGPEEH